MRESGGGFAVKRLLQEYRELEKEQREPDCCFIAFPLEEDLFEWHFTLKGPEGTPFEGGLYHGKILLPPDYPLKPPDIVLLTPNGRFETGRRICLSNSSFHEETWQPSWSIRSILLGLCSLFPCEAEGVGAINCDPEIQRRLARASCNFYCRQCNMTPVSCSSPKRAPSSTKTVSASNGGFFAKFDKSLVSIVLLFLFILGIVFILF